MIRKKFGNVLYERKWDADVNSYWMDGKYYKWIAKKGKIGIFEEL